MNNFDISSLVKAVERMATALEGIEASLDRISDDLNMDREESKIETVLERRKDEVEEQSNAYSFIQGGETAEWVESRGREG